MQLQTGNYVMYRSSEICRIDGFETKCFDGVTQREYCILVPENDQRSKYYVPMDRAEEKLRRLLSKDEIYALIESMKGEQPDWGDTEIRRKERFNEVLGSGDHRLIISMMHSLYLEKQNRISQGKKLLAADEKAMKAAEALINREFSFVLGISEGEIEGFILDTLSAR
ncbi:MAG: hypothetical protein IJZ95_09655 [Oscillospiraceae bacterium]|nr:hypothetical protein [Oscillospiraceae bacterium]